MFTYLKVVPVGAELVALGNKTEDIYRLVNQGRSYFLSRPRRFGKSLLLSTIGAYLEGRRELFSGLALEKLEKDWTVHPVLRLDLNAEHYTSTAALEGILDSHLRRWEGVYGSSDESSLSRRFLTLIRQAQEHSGQRVVVLIDEYDKPLLASLGKKELHEAFKAILKSFHGVLKSADAYLKFALLIGVTKFGQVSVFSDLNQLIDLTLHPAYATLCGITETELLATFQPELHALVELLKASDYDLRDLEGVELGQFIQAELRSAKGQADAVVSSAGFVYVFEFKLQGSAEEALQQIDRQGYLMPFSSEGRRLFKIGVEFDLEERNLGRWLIVVA